MKLFAIAALLLVGCGNNCRKVKLYSIMPEGQPCAHECATAAAAGGRRYYGQLEEAYFMCLDTCPGIVIKRECRTGDES